MGVPGSTNWDPDRQRAVIEHLLAAGADVAAASDRGSTPWDLAQRATGRSGSGAPEARAEQLRIVELLAQHR